MKPGATTRRLASITRLAAAALGRNPKAAILPFWMATSPMKDGSPVPSAIRPLRIRMSYCCALASEQRATIAGIILITSSLVEPGINAWILDVGESGLDPMEGGFGITI